MMRKPPKLLIHVSGGELTNESVCWLRKFISGK